MNRHGACSCCRQFRIDRPAWYNDVIMRLNDIQRRAIRNAVSKYFGSHARVFLFGSRVDDSRRGGDIDLLVEVSDIDPDSNSAITAKLSAVADIQRQIGERKIDLVVASPETDKPVVANARRSGVAV